MATVIKINEQNGELELSDIDITLDEQDGGWLAICPGLKVIGYSTKSDQEALEDLKFGLEGFFKIHLEENTLKEALLEFGWATKVVEEKQMENDPANKTHMFNIFIYE